MRPSRARSSGRRGAVPGWRAHAGRGALRRSSPGAVDAIVASGDEIAREITLQMGRPIAHSPGEVRGFEERARHMMAIAPGRSPT